jgi:hypothetical protein
LKAFHHFFLVAISDAAFLTKKNDAAGSNRLKVMDGAAAILEDIPHNSIMRVGLKKRVIIESEEHLVNSVLSAVVLYHMTVFPLSK